MGLTPNSSLTAYVTPADFLARQDVRAVGMLCSDNNVPITQSALLAGDPNLTAALMDASGEIEAAALIADRYQPGDLQALLEQNGVSGAYLKKICSAIAMRFLYDRRDGNVPPQNVIDKYDNAMKFLEEIKNGTVTLAFTESEEAGVPSSAVFTAADLLQANMMTLAYRRTMGNRLNIRRAFGGGSFVPGAP